MMYNLKNDLGLAFGWLLAGVTLALVILAIRFAWTVDLEF